MYHKKRKGPLNLLSLLLSLFLLSSFFVTPSAFVQGNTVLDVSAFSDRFLSDSVMADGGSVSLGQSGELRFDIMGSGAKLRFKCIGTFPEGKQNALCIQLNNATGSTELSFELAFMDMNSDTHTEQYRRKVKSFEGDSYVFLPFAEELFLTDISVNAVGIGSGSISIIGIWHCYYSFPTDNSDHNAGSLSCLEYRENGTAVLIEGLIHHDITIAEKNSKVNVYRLLPGESISEEFLSSHQPCASSLVSRRFTFTVKNTEGNDFPSSYAVVIQSPDGKLSHIIEDKRYPSGEGYTEKSEIPFKGIASALEFLPERTYTDTVVIDLPTDLLISDRPNGYIYSFCGENYCFNGSIINEADRKTASASAKTHNICFRLGINEPVELYGEKGSVYDADLDKAKQIYALISFLCERYGDNIGGIIIGAGYDIPESYKNLDGVAFDEYIRKYSDYVSVVASALANKNPEARVIIPLSSDNTPIPSDAESPNLYPMASMLISLLKTYSFSGSERLTFMICDDTFFTADELEEKLYGKKRASVSPDNALEDENPLSGISADNTAAFDKLLSSLSSEFSFIESKYMFLWEPKGAFSPDDLSACYAYNYFELCSEKNVISFICDFTADELIGFYTASEYMTDVMTEMGGSGAKKYADALTKRIGDFTFAGVDGYDTYSTGGSLVIEIPSSDILPTSKYGAYPIADFSDPSALSKWTLGAYSEYINMASVSGGKKALKAHMNLSYYSSEFSEIIYLFDSKKDLSDVSDISFTLMISEQENIDPSEYTVRTVIGGENVRCVSDALVTAEDGKPFVVSLDISEAKLTGISYVKICVQNNSGKNDQISLSVVSADAYSNTLSSDELEKLFADAENKNQNLLGKSENTKGKLLAYITVVAVSACAIGGICFFGRMNSEKEDEADEKDRE